MPYTCFLQAFGEIMPCESQKNGGHDFFGRWNRSRVFCSSFVGWSPLVWLFFHFWRIVMDPSFISPLTNRCRNSFALRLKRSEVSMQFHFYSHLVDSFPLPNFSCRIFCIHSVEMCTMSAMISWMLLTISSVVTSMGWQSLKMHGPYKRHASSLRFPHTASHPKKL